MAAGSEMAVLDFRKVPFLGVGAVDVPKLDIGASLPSDCAVDIEGFARTRVAQDAGVAGFLRKPFLGAGVIGVPEPNIRTVMFGGAGDIDGFIVAHTTNIKRAISVVEEAEFLGIGGVFVPNLDVDARGKDAAKDIKSGARDGS